MENYIYINNQYVGEIFESVTPESIAEHFSSIFGRPHVVERVRPEKYRGETKSQTVFLKEVN